MDLIRVTEEIVSKQAVETTDVLNLRMGAVSNMVDIRACSKPEKRVSTVRLFKNMRSQVLKESRRVLLGRSVMCVKWATAVVFLLCDRY